MYLHSLSLHARRPRSQTSRINRQIPRLRAIRQRSHRRRYHPRLLENRRLHRTHVPQNRRPRHHLLAPLGIQSLDGLAHVPRGRLLCHHRRNPHHRPPKHRRFFGRLRLILRSRIRPNYDMGYPALHKS